jgi:hypothetical protein
MDSIFPFLKIMTGFPPRAYANNYSPRTGVTFSFFFSLISATFYRNLLMPFYFSCSFTSFPLGILLPFFFRFRPSQLAMASCARFFTSFFFSREFEATTILIFSIRIDSVEKKPESVVLATAVV